MNNSRFLNHLPMRPGSGNIKLVRIHFPTMAFVKRDCRHAGVAPEKTDGRVLDDCFLGTLQQSAPKSTPLKVVIRAHPAKLPGRLAPIGVQHEARAGNERGVFIRWTRIKNSDVPREGIVITGELRRLQRQSRAKQPVAQADNLRDGNAADRDLLRCVLGQNFSHDFKRMIASIIPVSTFDFNNVVPGTRAIPHLTFNCS